MKMAYIKFNGDKDSYINESHELFEVGNPKRILEGNFNWLMSMAVVRKYTLTKETMDTYNRIIAKRAVRYLH